jgi:hypothetical protein
MIIDSIYDRVFEQRLEIKIPTILRVAKDLELPISESDICSNIKFLKEFAFAYPGDKTTTGEFSALLIFFTIRQNQGLKQRDKIHMYHLSTIQTFLKKNRNLCSAQVDFWRWFQRRLDIS